MCIYIYIYIHVLYVSMHMGMRVYLYVCTLMPPSFQAYELVLALDRSV